MNVSSGFFSCNALILYSEGDNIIVQNVTNNRISDAVVLFIMGEDFFDIENNKATIIYFLPSYILTFSFIYSFSFSYVIPKICI